MRLKGRRAIMRHFGWSPNNKDAWHKIRLRYDDVIRCFPRSGRVWARSEDLDLVDIQECETMTERLAPRGAIGEAVGEAVGGYPRQYQRLLKRLLTPDARGPG